MQLPDGTELREIPGLNGRYFASHDGRIWSAKRRSFRNPSTQRGGYLTITIRHEETKETITLSVHRLVALAWIPNPDDKPQVNHKDGKKQNNSVANLEWCTAQQNSQHAWETGLVRMTPPMLNGLRVGHEHQAARAKERAAELKDALSRHGQGRQRLPPTIPPARRLSAEQLLDARIRIARGEMQKDIAKEYGVSKALLSMRLTEITNKEIGA